MRIGGPFDTIKGPTVFLEISICICVRLTFPFNITNTTCHLKMHHFNKKTWKTGSDLLHLQAKAANLNHLCVDRRKPGQRIVATVLWPGGRVYYRCTRGG